jgi:hypothetical protein
LSGFIEADGNFYLNFKYSNKLISSYKKIINIIYYMRLSQKQIYKRKLDSSVLESNLKIMDKIAQSLRTPLINIHRIRASYDEHAYLVRTDRVESKEILFLYLNKYPLYGYKYFAQNNLGKIHNLIRTRKYKTEEGIEIFIKLSKLIKYNEINNN